MTTMETLEDIVAQLGVTMKELAETHKETERAMAKSREETERAMAKSREETERAMAKSREETERILTAKINDLNETVDKWIGYTGHSIGHIVELVLIPGIKKKMNECGHEFDTLAPRKLYYRKDGNLFTEIDLFLENGEEVMAVEVKTQLSISAVEHHLRRLQLLRKHEAERLNGKTILAAVAGLSIDEDAREMASRLGMYVIEMIEDTKNITVIKPAGGLGKW